MKSSLDATPKPLSRGRTDCAGSGQVSRRRLVLFAMCLAAFMIQLDVTILNVALPTIQHDLALNPSQLEWVISGYALSLAAFVPLAGALGDRFGDRAIVVGGLLLFGVGSTACALAPDSLALILARVVQGVGGAAMVALTLAVINRSFPASSRSRAIGIWAAVGGTGFGAGPIVGGLLIDRFGWGSIFWANVPFVLIAAVLVLVAVPSGRSKGPASPLDVVGVVLASAGLTGVTFGLIASTTSSFWSAMALGPVLLGFALLGALVLWQGGARYPLIPAALRRSRRFVGACTVYFASYTAFAGTLYYVTLLYQNLEGWSPLRTGVSWLFMNIPFLLIAQQAGRLERRFDPRSVIACGCMLGAIGVAILASLKSGTPFPVAALGYLLAGVGFGALVPAVTDVAMRDVPTDAAGAGSAMLNCSRQLGTATGLAMIGALGSFACVQSWGASWGPNHNFGLLSAALVSGRIDVLAQALGDRARVPAEAAFLHGYHVALIGAVLCLVAAAIVAVYAFSRTRRRATTRPHQASIFR